jgi:hypothetical protein
MAFLSPSRRKPVYYLTIRPWPILVELLQFIIHLSPYNWTVYSHKSKKQFHNTPMEARGLRIYSSYSFTTSALERVSGQRHAPATIYPRGKEHPVPTGQEAGWAPEPVWTQSLEKKSSCLCYGSKLDRPVVQSVARHYTDWATRLLVYSNSCWKTS